MKKLFIFITLLFIFFKPAEALASFDNLFVRLDNQTASTQISGTLCAKPSLATAGIENKVIITFPSDFTISSNASNWTTNVSNLPSGSTAWPLSGSTASSVSGQSVTFSSGDLTLDTLYCFRFTSTLSQTGGVMNDDNGEVVTKDASNSTIDSTNYALSIVANDQVNVTAGVEASGFDLPIQIEAVTPGTQFPQNTEITYKITYGSNATLSIPLTIQASWSQGTVAQDPAPSLDILDYVSGSAANAYGGATPVIDTTNRTITWTIASFPASTINQTVTFTLKTNSAYTGGSLVSFDASANASSGTTVTPDQTVTLYYKYSSSATTAVTPTPVTSEQIPTSAFSFNRIGVRSISSQNAQIYVSRNKDSILTMNYGTSFNNLNKTIKTSVYEKESLVNLSSLLPDTVYFFKVSAKDNSSNTITSDIYTFTTASVSIAPVVNLQSLVATSNNNILINTSVAQTNEKVIFVPQNSVFEVQFTVNKPDIIKNIEAIIRKKGGLDNVTAINLVQIHPGVYTGKLTAPAIGSYEIYIKTLDFNGNLQETKLVDLTSVNKFSVFDKSNNQPVENARVLLYLYNQSSKTYSLISSEILPIENPSFTNPDGTVDLVLPYGKYKAEISALSYSAKTIEFSIDPGQIGYPVVYLSPENFDILNQIKYYISTFMDNLSLLSAYLSARAASNRLFDFISMSSLLIFIFAGLIAFSAKTHIPLLYIPFFLIYKVKLLFDRKEKIIYGKVIDSVSGNPLTKANVYVINTKNHIHAHLKTNRLGEFYLNRFSQDKYRFTVMKKNYAPVKDFRIDFEKENAKSIIINLVKDEGFNLSFSENLSLYFEDFIGVLTEFLVLWTIVLEVFFAVSFGFLRILPFLTISFGTLFLLVLFLYKPKEALY